MPLPWNAVLTMLDAGMADPMTAKKTHANAESIDSSSNIVLKRKNGNEEKDTDGEASIVCIHIFDSLDEDLNIVDDLVGV